MNSKRPVPRLLWGTLPLLAIAPLLFLFYACKKPPIDTPVEDGPVPKGDPWFVDVTEQSGVRHVYVNGHDGGELRKATTAELHGCRHSKDPEPAQPGDDVRRNVGLAVDGGGVHLFIEEAAHLGHGAVDLFALRGR